MPTTHADVHTACLSVFVLPSNPSELKGNTLIKGNNLCGSLRTDYFEVKYASKKVHTFLFRFNPNPHCFCSVTYMGHTIFKLNFS
jgi:hypothetical protein